MVDADIVLPFLFHQLLSCLRVVDVFNAQHISDAVATHLYKCCIARFSAEQNHSQHFCVVAATSHQHQVTVLVCILLSVLLISL